MMAVFSEAETCFIKVIHNNTTQNFSWLRALALLLFVFASHRHVYPKDIRVISNRQKAEDTPAIKLDIA